MIVTDDQGNVNNLLVVQNSQEVVESPFMTPDQVQTSVESHIIENDRGHDFPKAEEPGLPPAVPVSELSVQAADKPIRPLTQIMSSASGKVTPVQSVSHDLPTPPISEEGDGVESKEALTDSAKNVPRDTVHESQASQSPKEKMSSTAPSSPPSSWWNRNR